MVSKFKAVMHFAAFVLISSALYFMAMVAIHNDSNKVVTSNAQQPAEVKQPLKVKELNYPDHLKELVAQYEKDLASFSEDQIAVMMTVADLTYDSDLAYTAAAQVWTESEFGKYPVDLEGLSCGLGHKRMNFYVKENNLPDTSFSRNKQCSRFMSDHKLAMETYLKDFEYWRKYHLSKGLDKREAYINAIKSYNAGKYVNSKDAERYYDKVRARVIVLQKHYDFKVLVAAMRGSDTTRLAAK